MYESYWGLKEKPFENVANPKFFFASAQHQEACARMLYCIREHKGAGVLTGVFGCGKTLVGRTIFKELNQERYRHAFVTNPRLGELDFLRMIAHELGVAQPPMNKTDVLIALQHVLRDNSKEGRDTVIVIDEAHAIQDRQLFEELRLLLNYQEDEQFLLTLLLIGQPELAAIINENKPLEQRIAIKCRLDPLSREETTEYILHRLRVAGHPSPEMVFGEEAITVVYESTGGIPRRINRLCDICLLAGMGAGVRSIEPLIVTDEVRGMTV